MLLDNKIWIGQSDEGPVTFLPAMANRHGLISGATGTGKTVTLQQMAEGFSQLGVPVFMADVKGDLAGLIKPGEAHPKILQRLEKVGIEHFSPKGNPVTFFDVFGKGGHPVRTTVSEMGPLLLGRLLDLNETQTGVLHLIFRIADDEGMLLIDLKDLRAMLSYVGENAGKYTIHYGNITKASVGAIQRAIAMLEDQGGDLFFGEPSLNIADWIKQDENGRGVINILAAEKLFLKPNVYSAFLLWMLGELYEFLPEQGDSTIPRMVFFFDEAHLLFNDCPKALLEKVELTIRLIRSKGVGVFFVTQNPADVPSSVLSQLAARIQHALRAFTPQEQRIVKTVAQTFRPNPNFDTETAIMSLGTGEALVSVLMPDGAPSVTQKTMILPPQSQIGAISEQLRQTVIQTSELFGKYDEAFDRESAYEVLSQRFAQSGIEAIHVLKQEVLEGSQAEPAARKMGYKVFDPASGRYIVSEEAAPIEVQQPMVRSVPARQSAPAPVLVFNPQTGQYEPQEAAHQELKAQKVSKAQLKKEKSLGEKMLENFMSSTVRGAGYSTGRSISRGILGVFGIK